MTNRRGQDEASVSSGVAIAGSTQHEVAPPDVGLMPWLQVLGGFFVMFNSWGLLLSFGSYQTYYTIHRGITDEQEPSNVAWIGSVQVLLTLLGTSLIGKWIDAGYMRILLLSGTAVTVFGLFMTSLASKYYQFMLAQGVVTGVGMALFCIIGVTIPSTWFVKRRGLAVGIVSVGASLAGIIYPITFQFGISSVGFPWTVRIVAFMVLGSLTVSLLCMRQRLPPKKRKGLYDWEALRQIEYSMYVIGIFFSFVGFFNLLSFVAPWIAEENIDTKGLPGFYILPIVNAASIIGRVLPSYVADYIGALNVQVPGLLVSGILVLCWLPVDSLGGLLVLSILYGVFSGALISVTPMAAASMTPDMTRFGGRIGLIFVSMGLGSFIGTPVTGAFVQVQGHYDGARLWSGLCLIMGSVFIAVTRMIIAKGAIITKV